MQARFVVVFILLLTFVSMGLLLANHLFDVTESSKFPIIVGTGTIASGLSAILMSYVAIRSSQFEAIKEFSAKLNLRVRSE